MSLKRILKEAQKLEREWREQQRAKETEIPEDFLEFCTKFLKLKLTEYQLEATGLLDKHSDVALRWCRQSGKTHLIAAWLLHYAMLNPGVHIAVVGPSWRQTMIPITKMNYFMTKLPKGLFHKPQRTIVRLKNGSIIQAFPNNPNNLRGFTLQIVYCDEMNFIPNDEEMYDAISFTLATTNGKFIASSTPWTTDSVFARATFLKQCIVEKRLKIPYDSDLIAELNIERFELTKDGRIKFNHPEMLMMTVSGR